MSTRERFKKEAHSCSSKINILKIHPVPPKHRALPSLEETSVFNLEGAETNSWDFCYRNRVSPAVENGGLPECL